MNNASPFEVPSFQHLLGGLVARHTAFWLWLGRLETRLLAEELQQVPIQKPIYVCGLARSGSTLLHEVVCTHPHVASQRMKDYPMIFTPYWWRRATRNVHPQAPRERTHGDGVLVTTESPDASEEMIWMAFFPVCHEPLISNVVAAGLRHPAFASFYQNHIRKLLLVERATRYAAKANYHVARLSYLVRLFPDARFLVPVRAPASHIASLFRQQRRFSSGQRKQRRALAFMQRSGHFEFGLDRRPMNLGDCERVLQIMAAWEAGDEVRGLAMYWNMVYGYVFRLLESDSQVRAATHVVRFETMCASPVETLRALLGHCELADAENIVAQHAPNIRYPAYYKTEFSRQDLDVIHEETASTAQLWGY